MSLVPHSGHIYRCARFELDEIGLTLKVGGELVPLPIKPWATLLLLAQHAPDTVSKAELMDTVWLGRVVTEGVLTQVISRLRVLLGDQNQEVIKTVHGVGFRLTLPVTQRTLLTGKDSGTEPVDAPAPFALGPHTILRGRPLWALTRALSTSKRTAVWLVQRKNDQLQRVFKFAHDGAGLRALKRELSVTRVLQAAQTASGICAVIDADFSEAPFFIELPYFNGGNLVDFYDSHSANISEYRLTILIAIARAIADCHAVGIIHGDIKPKNILLELDADQQATARLADFGAALLLDQARLRALELSAIHSTGLVVSDPGGGTLAYAAPEILAGKPATVATDAYAFGVTAFQLLCGEFSRPLSPGWEALIDDPLLRSDISDMCQADPGKRPNFHDIATRLASLDARTEAAIIRTQELAEFEAVKADSARREQERALDLARIDYLSRRRRLLRVSVIALASLLLLAGTGFFLALQQSRIALAQTHIARTQKAAAEKNAQDAAQFGKRAELVKDIVIKTLLEGISPYEGGDPNALIVNLLPKLGDQLSAALAKDPMYAGELLANIGDALIYAKRYQGSEHVLRSVLQGGQALPPEKIALIRLSLGDALRLQGFSLESQQHYLFVRQHGTMLPQIKATLDLAIVALAMEKPENALLHIASARKIMLTHAALAADWAKRPSFRFGIQAFEAQAYAQMGKYQEADTIFQSIINEASAVPATHGFVPAGINGMALVQQLQGQYNAAITLQKQAIAQLDPQLSAGSLDTYEIQLATMHVQAKHYDQAEAILRHYLDSADKSELLGTHYVALAQAQLARIYFAHGKRVEATALLSKAKTGIEICLGKDSAAFVRILAFEKELAG